jgi:hypothetical protein
MVDDAPALFRGVYDVQRCGLRHATQPIHSADSKPTTGRLEGGYRGDDFACAAGVVRAPVKSGASIPSVSLPDRQFGYWISAARQ